MPPHKGSSIVILNKNDYNEEWLKILFDRHFYEELKEDTSVSYKDRFTEIIEKLLHDNLITKNEYDILLEGNETPTFYALAKTYKIFEKLPPFLPIHNGKNLVSVWMSEFVDSFLKPASRLAQSYIKDTTDFIDKISGLKFIPECPKEKVFVSMDLQSLYPNIDRKEGVDACSHVLDKRTNQSFPTRVIVKLIQLILKCNVMSFNGRLFHQIKGMAMGTPMAVSYAYLCQNSSNVYYNTMNKDTNINKPYGWES